MRRAARTDKNQSEIVDALRRAGCSVQCLHQLGGGVPDLLVGRDFPPPTRGTKLFLLEVKADARAAKRKGRTADEQLAWRRAWCGPVAVVTSVDEALRAVGLLS